MQRAVVQPPPAGMPHRDRIISREQLRRAVEKVGPIANNVQRESRP